MYDGVGYMIKGIYSFQKLMFMNLFTNEATRKFVDRSRNSGYKANTAVYILSFLSLIVLNLFFSSTLLTMVMISLISLYMIIIRGSFNLYKILPVKKSFTVANLFLTYLTSILAMASLLFVLIGMPVIMSSIIAQKNAFDFICGFAKPYLISFFVGWCFFALLLAIYFIKRNAIKVIISAALLAISGVVAIALNNEHQIFSNYFNIFNWANKIDTVSFCSIIAASLIILLSLYFLCVKLYERHA
jgi:hypothetical protein